jgi:GTP-binding protein
VVLLLDVRHAPSRDDLQMLDFLAELGAPTVVALTKTDKLPARELPERVREIGEELGLDEAQMIPFSATTNLGRDELAAAVAARGGPPALGGAAPRGAERQPRG